MASHSVIEFTTGVPGAGKSLLRGPRFVVMEFFAADPHGVGLFISNFPLNPHAIAEKCVERYGGELRQYLDRIVCIPEGELKRWRSDAVKKLSDREKLESPDLAGPWSFFAETDLAGCHIAIDELHHYCGRSCSVDCRRLWQRWLAEARHMGVTVEGLTQDADKVAEEFVMEAAIQRSIVHTGTSRSIIWGFVYGDLYELRAKLTGKYNAKTVVTERRKKDRSWVVHHKETLQLDPVFFPMYNSFSAPQAGGKAALNVKYEFEKRSWPALLLWFLRRNGWPIATRLVILLALLWAFLGHTVGLGGVKGVALHVMREVLGKMSGRQKADQAKRKAEREASKPASALKAIPSGPMRPSPALLGPPSITSGPPALPSETLVMIRPTAITLSIGGTYALGDTIETGPLKGKSVARVDLARRYCVLDDGRLLRLGQVELVRPAPPGQPAGAPASSAVASGTGNRIADRPTPGASSRSASAESDALDGSNGILGLGSGIGSLQRMQRNPIPRIGRAADDARRK